MGQRQTQRHGDGVIKTGPVPADGRQRRSGTGSRICLCVIPSADERERETIERERVCLRVRHSPCLLGSVKGREKEIRDDEGEEEGDAQGIGSGGIASPPLTLHRRRVHARI